MTAELIAKKLELKGMIRFNGIPVLLLIENVISEDWEIADDGIGMEVTK